MGGEGDTKEQVVEDESPAGDLPTITPIETAAMFLENYALIMKPMTEVLYTAAASQNDIITLMAANRSLLTRVTAECDEVAPIFEKIPSYADKISHLVDRMKATSARAAAMKQQTQRAAEQKKAELAAHESRCQLEQQHEAKLTAK
ncbi:hypothetical protein DIPPA_03303 [Diplonema papillatum]|nr:hypothetical protein DIPPA_03303 [Diplonema papillatum]